MGIAFSIRQIIIRKLKQFLYSPGEALGLQEVEGARMSRPSVDEGGTAVSLTLRSSLPPGDIPGTHFC